jgi:hypothetical protein
MALPFLFETGHFLVMAMTAFVMIRERLGPADGAARLWGDRARNRLARLPGA